MCIYAQAEDMAYVVAKIKIFPYMGDVLTSEEAFMFLIHDICHFRQMSPVPDSLI